MATTTYLEMHSAAEVRPKLCSDERWWVGEAVIRQWQFNRFLYLTVGVDWAWTDKSAWSEAQWRQYVESDDVRTFVAYHEAAPAGYFELRRDGVGGVEIAYFGLLPAFIGHGFGGPLLTSALTEAWAMKPSRVWVHTCTLDHPAALANYQARGMKIYQVSPGHA